MKRSALTCVEQHLHITVILQTPIHPPEDRVGLTYPYEVTRPLNCPLGMTRRGSKMLKETKNFILNWINTVYNDFQIIFEQQKLSMLPIIKVSRVCPQWPPLVRISYMSSAWWKECQSNPAFCKIKRTITADFYANCLPEQTVNDT